MMGARDVQWLAATKAKTKSFSLRRRYDAATAFWRAAKHSVLCPRFQSAD